MSTTERELDRPIVTFVLPPSDAVVAVLVGASIVDGILGTEESRRLDEVLAATRWALGFNESTAAEAATRARKLIAEHGLSAVLQASAAVIPADLRATTFALAVDLVLADGRLGSRESAFIDQLQAALHIEHILARKVLDVLLLKNRASGRPDM